MAFYDATPVLPGIEQHQNEGRSSHMSKSKWVPNDPLKNNAAPTPLESSNSSQSRAALKNGESFIRTTVGNRVLRYFLEVHQQPERARACGAGAGAKGSANRRPLDPPPVLSLRIFEERNGVDTDITFSYDATLFLVATVDIAKPKARGSVPLGSRMVPVLTGAPVATANYLDRPREAIWFAFPDLSLRHEGKYTLSFHLYETSKNPDDCDRAATDASLQLRSESDAEASSPWNEVCWRMEVKSTVFEVYNAKKFPGLRESTILSRTLAEQGVRMRIRRDVRMRRYDRKGNGDYDTFGEEDTHLRRTSILKPDHGSYIRDRQHIGMAADIQTHAQKALEMTAIAEQRVLKSMGKVVPHPLAANMWDFRPQEPLEILPSSPVASPCPSSPILLPTSIEFSPEISSGMMENLIPGERMANPTKEHSTILKESIWSTFVESLRFMVGADYHVWSALGTPIQPIDDEPQSHAAKRASQDWWLSHPSEPWENILPPSHIPSPRHLFSVILSSWHQDFEASSQHLRDGGDWSDFLSSSPEMQEARVIEQLVNDISIYMGRTSTGSVKRPAGESSTSNATPGTGLASSSSSTRYQTSKITGKRRGRHDAASNDDGSNDDQPNQNDKPKRVRKNVAQYSRYVICTEFAADESTACFSCYWGGWPSVDRLKQDHLVKVHRIDTSMMKIEKGGTEAEKWWRLFDKLHPGFRDGRPEVFIPGPFFEDRVAQNTYNKVFSEAMQSVERVQQRNTQSLASAINGLLNTQRDHERQEIRQIVVEILRANTGDTDSNGLLGESKRTGLESDYFSQDTLNTISPTRYPRVHQRGYALATSSAPRSDCIPSASNINRASRIDSSLRPALNAERNFANQIIVSAQSPFIDSTHQNSDVVGIQHDLHNIITTPPPETPSDTPTVRPSNGLDAQQLFPMTVCRCREHSANCDSCKQDGAEFCMGCSGWFCWSAYAEPFLLH